MLSCVVILYLKATNSVKSVCDHDNKFTDPAVPVSLLCHRGGVQNKAGGMGQLYLGFRKKGVYSMMGPPVLTGAPLVSFITGRRLSSKYLTHDRTSITTSMRSNVLLTQPRAKTEYLKTLNSTSIAKIRNMRDKNRQK